MPEPLACPSCGAPLDPSSTAGSLVTCRFCHRSAVVPRPGEGGPRAPASTEHGALEAELRALIAGERKIEAIKRYREAFGGPLVVAKNAVDALEAGGGLRAPTAEELAKAKASARPSPGCLAFAALLVAAIAAAVAFGG